MVVQINPDNWSSTVLKKRKKYYFVFWNETWLFGHPPRGLVTLLVTLVYIRGKVKCTLLQALGFCTGRTTHRESRGIAIPFHDHGPRREWEVCVTPRPLFTPGKTRYPLYRCLGGSQVRSGQVRKISPPEGFDPRAVQPVASCYNDWHSLPKLDYIVST
jgi:hypothetical protein